MPKIIIHSENIPDLFEVFGLCPNGALEFDSTGKLITNLQCKLCKLCIINGPDGAFELK